MFGEKGEAVAGTRVLVKPLPAATPTVRTQWGVNGLITSCRGQSRSRGITVCLSVDRRVGGKPRTGARGGVPAEGASTPSLARRAPTKPGVWPMGVPRSGSQAGVTGSSWVSAASLLPLQTPASRLRSPHWRTSAPLRPLSSFELQGFSETSQIKSFSLTAS